jgi:hypothetical protein
LVAIDGILDIEAALTLEASAAFGLEAGIRTNGRP